MDAPAAQRRSAYGETFLSLTWVFYPPTTLVYGGSSGHVHLTGVLDYYTAATMRGVTVLSWDIQ